LAGHFRKECRTKCKRCKKFGHTEANCNKAEEQEGKAKRVVIASDELRATVEDAESAGVKLQPVEDEGFVLTFGFEGRPCDAFVDCGSDYNLMDVEVFQAICPDVQLNERRCA